MAQSTRNTKIDTNKLNAALAQEVNELEQTRKQVAQQYKEEKKYPVQGSPMYQPYFGRNMPIIINGIPIYVPLDGQQYMIPETYAALFQERISKVDEQIRVRNSMANIQSNSERYAGEKDLIRKG